MTRSCRIEINGQSFSVNAGAVLLDAALENGVDMPFDCRSGDCGSCLVHLTSGLVVGGSNAQTGMIHACQARIVSDLTVSTGTDLVKPAARGKIVEINQLCSDALEVVLALDRPPSHRPGQYYNVQFNGFPARAYSPSPAIEFADEPDKHLLRFHVRQISLGAVSSHLDNGIRTGHDTKLFGPFGTACFEPNRTERLILVSGGTGFAPIWSIADAALNEREDRSIVLVAGVRGVSHLYMAPALHIASLCPNVTVIAVTREKAVERYWLRYGNLFNHLPELYPEDIIHAAGPPPLVEALSKVAVAVGCRMHADPFLPTGLAQQRKDRKANTAFFGGGRKLSAPEMIPFPQPAVE
jgi:NAD(P)H-flavin reductase/ferredoxin